MRIATSTIFENQTSAIDNLVAQQQQYGTQLSSGLQLNAPSDNPTEIAQDLGLRTTIAQENQSSTNVQNVTSQLTTVDSALSSLGSVLQSARSIAIQGASGTIDAAQQQSLATQVDNLLQEAIGIGNTQYGGKYVFGGTSANGTAPVRANGQPISSVTFTGNLAGTQEATIEGQSIPIGATLQQAFNYSAPDGSPDVFQTLINLRDTLQNGTVADESATSVNNAGTALAPATPINTAGILKTPLVADSSGNVDISITSAKTTGTVITIPAGSTLTAALAAINAATATTGISASFNARTQRLTLSSSVGAFQVNDVPSPGSPTAGNFIEAFGLQTQADVGTYLSTQLGDIDNATQVLLNTRAAVGGDLQNLATLGNTISSQVVNDTKVQSNIEDADIAKVASQFSQTQTALQAAYSTTSRLEGKSLFDYIT